MFLGDVIVKAIPAIDGSGRSVKSAHIAISDMESLFEKGDVGLRFMSPESGPNDPWLPFGCLFWNDDFAVEIVDLKVGLLETVEF